MSELLRASQPSSHTQSLREDALRRLSRSPHPYHRQQFELSHGSEVFTTNAPPTKSPLRSAQNTDDEERDSRMSPEASSERANSDSGTEADDEHFLKGLPAPKIRPHKGLRGAEGVWSSTPSPLMSPAILDESTQRSPSTLRRDIATALANEEEVRNAAQKFRRKRRVEIIRRATEAGILLFVTGIIGSNREVRQMLKLWKRGKSHPHHANRTS
jgi:hypothetical protein